MRTLLLLALFVSTSAFACDKQGTPPPGQSAGSSAGVVETPPPPVESGASGTAGGSGDLTACGKNTCAEGEQCISYYGIAGPRGPEFKECGIRCKKGQPNDGCPADKHCTTIADGPGPVCR